jgi:hypothetical protein
MLEFALSYTQQNNTASGAMPGDIILGCAAPHVKWPFSASVFGEL